MKIKSLLICALAALFAKQGLSQTLAQKSETRDAQAAAQRAPAAAPDATTPDDPKFAALAYDVASIKPHKDDNSGRSFSGSSQPDDGYSATNTTLRNLIFAAYSSASHSELSGGPSWINEDRYDVEARFDGETIEALKKLSPRERRLARQHMLQMFLKERVRVEVRLSTKEVPSFDLVVGKGGLKIKEALDPNEDGHGSAMMSMNQGMATMTA